VFSRERSPGRPGGVKQGPMADSARWPQRAFQSPPISLAGRISLTDLKRRPSDDGVPVANVV